MSEPKKDEQKERSMLIALILFLGAGALIFMSLGSDNKKARGASSKTKTSEYQKNVNRHLMLTNERMEMERKRMAIENFQSADRFQDSKAQKAYQPNQELDLSTDTRGYEIANEIRRGPKESNGPSTPDEVVQAELYLREQANQYDEAYREEYARQFVENARRGGFKVKLSEDLSRVISVQPIRNPSGGDIRYDGGSTQ
jgi:rhamnose utilization protein RhaD (predicted bifunctional aldolase and dehydrogenase)